PGTSESVDLFMLTPLPAMSGASMDGAATRVDRKEKQPLVLDQVAHQLVLGDDPVDGVLRRLEEHAEALWYVDPLGTVTHRLEGETDTQVTPCPFEDPDASPDDVVQHLVAAPVAQIVHGRRVVLHVDE